MININGIKHLHMEFSTLCNSRCPLCPRNANGYPFNNGYKETNLSLDLIKKSFTPEFIRQLKKGILVNGNFGDFVMNPESLDILSYFKSHYSDLSIKISTNGSARSVDFWSDLANLTNEVMFCLDGLEDTHSLYRIDTDYHKILSNANVFMQAGGNAVWKMIKFDHNQHQIESCREISKELGFKRFELVDQGRNSGPVFDKHGNLLHILGDYTGEKSFEILFHKKKTDMVLLEDIIDNIIEHKTLTCGTKQNKSIYISSTGDVYPCCYTAFNPETYGHGEYHEAVNAQLAPLIKNNNALTYTLEECILWFNAVEESWDKSSFEDGKLVCCNDNCGSN